MFYSCKGVIQSNKVHTSIYGGRESERYFNMDKCHRYIKKNESVRIQYTIIFI